MTLGKNTGLTLIFLSIFSASMLLFAQTDKKKLQDRKVKIEQEIKQTNRQLEETKKTKQSSLKQLQLIDKKIGKREELIHEIGTEVQTLDNQVDVLSDTIVRLTKNLQQLKTEYAKLICSVYKTRNQYSQLVFLFSAPNFNQALKRIQYLKYYTNFRKSQVKQIVGTQVALGSSRNRLEGEKEDKLTLLQKQESEKQKLTTEKAEKDKTVKSLTQKEKQLSKKLQEKESAKRKLQNEIQLIVSEEIHKANVAKKRVADRKAVELKASAEKAAKTKATAQANAEKAKAEKSLAAKTAAVTPVSKPTTETSRMSSNEAEYALSDDFVRNRGRLPYPVEKGTIVSSFGEHEHPDYKGIIFKNDGVDIVVAQGVKATAIFDGVVSSVIHIAGMHYVAIIRHGDYLTVYSNLESVLVKKGEKIKTRHTIGSIATNEETQKATLHFEVWKGTTVLNPSAWIKK